MSRIAADMNLTPKRITKEVAFPLVDPTAASDERELQHRKAHTRAGRVLRMHRVSYCLRTFVNHEGDVFDATWQMPQRVGHIDDPRYQIQGFKQADEKEALKRASLASEAATTLQTTSKRRPLEEDEVATVLEGIPWLQ